MFIQKILGSSALLTGAAILGGIVTICIPQTRALAADAVGFPTVPASPTEFVMALAGGEATGSVGENFAAISGVYEEGVAVLGGKAEVAKKRAVYEAAVKNGTPLAEAQISEEDRASLAATGATVVVPCSVTNPTVAMLSDLLAAEGGDAIPCGASNPDVPAYAPAEKS